jgi:hypothetical protein
MYLSKHTHILQYNICERDRQDVMLIYTKYYEYIVGNIP